MNAPHVRVDVDPPLAWITLARPERLNALGATMRDDLEAALREVGGHPEVRVVVLTGAGRAFCAGADLDAMADLLDREDEETIVSFLEAGARVIRRLRTLAQPVVAALNGPAAGAGAALALACDFRLAADTATIALSFTRIGLQPDWGASYFLPRIVGLARALDLALTGRPVEPAEALAMGLVHRVLPSDGFRRAVEGFARELATRPPLALAAAKRTLSLALESDLDAVLAHEQREQLTLFRTADVREGVAAFREKRTPRFAGR